MTDITTADYYRVRQETERRRLSFYRPYRKQQEFHRDGATYRERLLRAGNQCISPWTFIKTGQSERLSGDIFFEKDADVLSWGGEVQCISQIEEGTLLGLAPVFRVILEHGEFFDCTPNHHILTELGYFSVSQIMSSSNGLRLKYKAEDYQASCVEYGYLYDPQLPWEEDSAPRELLGQDGVPTRILCFSREDAEERTHQYTSLFPQSDHHSTFVCDPKQRAALFSLFSAPAQRTSVLPLSHAHRENLRRLAELDHQSLPSGELLLDEGVAVEIFYPLISPALVGGKKIVAYVPIGFQPVIDCQVKNTKNYCSSGVYQHNCGKTLAAAAEVGMHSTGKYPPWWEGRVFKKAPVIWCGGITGEVTRDTIQRLLIGDEAASQGGFIPADDIIETTPSRGVADLKDTILVRHASGGTTRIRLKYYEQGREKWQGDTVDLVWFDEEPPLELYMEGLTRTNATGGMVFLTFTPLKGMSETVRRFLVDNSPDRSDTNMTIMDALHISPEERQKIVDSYPAHEREARLNGTPMLGSGRIFPISESEIMVKPFNPLDMPWYWMEIAGIDFGWDHPTAAAKLLYDPQGDIVYVTNVYKRREATPLIHAAALKPWGSELQWAWPHDGLQHDKGSGVQLKEQYQQQGLKMLGEKATFDDERSNGREAVIAEALMRMESGRFKVFAHLTEFFEEFRLFHRKDGKIVAEYEDILSACFYALMMLRYAKPIRPPASGPNGASGFVKSNYNPLSIDYIKKTLGERR